MRLVTDQKLVERNANIGKYALQGGLVLLVGALVIDIYGFTRPQNFMIIVYAMGAFLVGFILTNVSAYFTNRWGRRPDKGLNDALKGLDERYALYHYRLGASHVLFGPSGTIVLLPKYQPGPIQIQKGKWQAPGAQRGPLGMFTNDPIGNPVAEAADEVERLNAYLKKGCPCHPSGAAARRRLHEPAGRDQGRRSAGAGTARKAAERLHSPPTQRRHPVRLRDGQARPNPGIKASGRVGGARLELGQSRWHTDKRCLFSRKP